MLITINGASHEVGGDEIIVDMPPGNVTLETDGLVVFWCASPDPSVRKGDYRTELTRLHRGAPITMSGIPQGWKLAFSHNPDLPAEQRHRPRAEPTPPPQGPTAEELAALELERRIRADMHQAETVNLAVDIIMSKLGKPVAPEPDRAFPAMTEPLSAYGDVGEGGEDFVGVFPAWLTDHAVDGEDVNARIARLSADFKKRVNELNNLLLSGQITPEEDAELTDKQAKYNELAELGDRS